MIRNVTFKSGAAAKTHLFSMTENHGKTVKNFRMDVYCVWCPTECDSHYLEYRDVETVERNLATTVCLPDACQLQLINFSVVWSSPGVRSITCCCWAENLKTGKVQCVEPSNGRKASNAS